MEIIIPTDKWTNKRLPSMFVKSLDTNGFAHDVCVRTEPRSVANILNNFIRIVAHYAVKGSRKTTQFETNVSHFK